jgi:REP element-mobilizing transposase RayT
VSNVHRLRLTDCIFFVNVNLRPRIRRFNESEYALLIDVLEASRRRLGFWLCGYVLMPDHWYALIWPQYPLLIWLAGVVREPPVLSPRNDRSADL